MSSRERKRAERRKRKQRGLAARAASGKAGSTSQDGEKQPVALRYRASSEARNEVAREALEPLEAAERPRIVTVGAGICALVALSTVIGHVAGIEVDGERPNLVAVAAPAILFAVMAVGMWRARYWAVLGFQAVLAFIILAAALGLIAGGSLRQLIATTLLLAGAGALFWYQVKAMARIQMPSSRLPRE